MERNKKIDELFVHLEKSDDPEIEKIKKLQYAITGTLNRFFERSKQDAEMVVLKEYLQREPEYEDIEITWSFYGDLPGEFIVYYNKIPIGKMIWEWVDVLDGIKIEWTMNLI